MTWRIGLAVALAAALIGFVACGKSDGGGDSETHWLKTCASDPDCGGDGTCLCNVCTTACTVGGACTGGPPGSSCVAGASAPVCDGVTPVPSGICWSVVEQSRSDGGNARILRSSLSRATPDDEAGVLATTVAANTTFAFDLYQQLRTTPGNLFFSPFNISTAMAMAWAGATGQTATEIANVFHFASPAVETHRAFNALDQSLASDAPHLALHQANAVWTDPQFPPLASYLDTVGQYYGAGVGVVNFEDQQNAADTIDGWVSSETEGTVPELLSASDLQPGTQLVLTAAIYFEGFWASPFGPSGTYGSHFTLADGTTVPVQMMDQTETLRYAATADYAAASIPYETVGQHQYEMLVVLPSGDLASFEPSLDDSRLNAIIASLSPQTVELDVPRTDFRTKLNLRDTLSAMGMPTPFLEGGGFLAMLSDPADLLYDVVHDGFLSLDETGTTASGATAVIVGEDGGISLDPPPPPPLLELDRPFLVVIRDTQSGTVLFLGRVANPTE